MRILSVPYFMGESMEGFAVPEPHDTLAVELEAPSPAARMGQLYRRLATAVATDPVPLVYAGDCVCAIGVLAGLQHLGIEPTLVWYDAHGDFNTPATTPSGFLGGMPLAMIVGRGDPAIAAAAGLTPLPEQQAVLVGARDLDPGEAEALEGSDVRMVEVADVDGGLVPDGPLYVHVDVDVVDPAEMPAVNYPAPGGPPLAAVAASLQRLAATGRVAAVSLSCWNPELPEAERAAAASRELAAPFLDRH